MSFYMPPDSGEKVRWRQFVNFIERNIISTLIVSSVNCLVLAGRSTELWPSQLTISGGNIKHFYLSRWLSASQRSSPWLSSSWSLVRVCLPLRRNYLLLVRRLLLTQDKCQSWLYWSDHHPPNVKLELGIYSSYSISKTDWRPCHALVLLLFMWGLYYGVTISLVSFATGLSVVTLNLHHRGMRGQRWEE